MKTVRRVRSQSGFTLVEMLVALTALAGAASAAFQFAQ